MSELSYLEKLLDGVEVKWLPLGHIAAIKTGQSVNKNMISKNPGVYPVINSGREPLGFINTWNTDNDPIGITTRGAGVGSVIWQEGKYFRGNLNYSITIDKKSHINIRYMYHALLHMKNDIHELCTFDGIPALNAGSLKKLLIPIPCPDNPEKSLAIQSEIVRILDKFTAITAELTAELNMRKKQYNYYRDQLLSFKEGEVEWKTLGEVAVIGTGNHDTQDAIEHGKYIFYARGREPLKLNVFDFDETAIITAGDGAGVGKVFHYAKGKYALHQRAYRIVPNAFMNPRFVYHYITAYFFTYIQKASVSSSVTSLRRPMFLKFPIPVPPSEEQARIVEILDKFDTLTNSITEGLPREIELRQKQYEYYRDLLFSFPKPETVSN
ncbi:TPA: restriction endonuclease subunit S [Klebsiella pneumoniae]|nr:restriction endonuclease subunit S [Klebsiella pneumoniae]HBS9629661.1 restriction endonuclease subunit S [Klebsiella pneumoniae]